MAVTYKASSTVKPSEPTWTGTLPLSEWDQIGTIIHISTIYFYKPPPKTPFKTITTTLKTSLARTLVHFYPLAGRLDWIGGGRLHLICNNAGVHFIEAETESTLDSLLGDSSPNPDYDYLVSSVDYTIPIRDLPLLKVQVTKFQCGGVSVSVNISHVLVDGRSLVHFMYEWTRIARGEKIMMQPFLDRKVLRAGENQVSNPVFDHKEFDQPPILIGEKNNVEQRKKKTMVAKLKLSKSQLEKLQNSVNNNQMGDNCRPYTRYETITGHIWRVACKSRNHKHEQQIAVSVCVDFLNRLNPPLPKGYFGNAILDVIATGRSGEVVGKPLEYAVGLVRKVIMKVSDEYVKSGIVYLKSQEDLTGFQDIHEFGVDGGPFYGNPNVQVVSWLGFPTIGFDFGWGEEVYKSPGTHDFDGDVLILPGQDEDDDGGLVVSVCLQVQHMEAFKKYFYEDM